jgi:hypothetical protein
VVIDKALTVEGKGVVGVMEIRCANAGIAKQLYIIKMPMIFTAICAFVMLMLFSRCATGTQYAYTDTPGTILE